jgi:hypothetical protein
MGIRVSPRTVGKYLTRRKPPGSSGQRWTNFVRNHAQAIVARDFFVSVTASFRVLYVFVVMEVGSRHMIHSNVTAHPTSEWTIQQFREVMAFDHAHRFGRMHRLGRRIFSSYGAIRPLRSSSSAERACRGSASRVCSRDSRPCFAPILPHLLLKIAQESSPHWPKLLKNIWCWRWGSNPHDQ